jgi:thymidylate synthase (FAD)
MENTIKVLDHGFVKLLNISSPVNRELTEENPFSARDIDPAKCARISFNNFEQEREENLDLKLVKYLIENQHWTPIEMTEVWVEMKLPIFVARQFVRHRTACINEVSGRYVTLPKEFYIPNIVGGKATNNKQGQTDNLNYETQRWFQETLEFNCENSYRDYEEAIFQGVAPEHARLLLHLNHYTHWIWKQDLRNLISFLNLRLHSHAQIEAREYAQAILNLVSKQLPKTFEILNTIKG